MRRPGRTRSRGACCRRCPERHARPLPLASRPRRCDLFLDGLATVVTEGRAAGAASLRGGVDAFLSEETSDSDSFAGATSRRTLPAMLWDWKSWGVLSARHIELARVRGALAPLVDRTERTRRLRGLVR